MKKLGNELVVKRSDFGSVIYLEQTMEFLMVLMLDYLSGKKSE